MPTNELQRTHATRYAAALPQITSTAHLSTQNATHTHQTLCCRITTNNLHNFKKLIKTFKFSDFNKEPTSSLKMIWKGRNMLERFFKCFNIDILD
jgi:hypothetical protein